MIFLIDLATRFCAACVIADKKPSTIMRNLFSSWVRILCSPKSILFDNGGELNNTEGRYPDEATNIEILCTAAASSWTNCACDRLNAVLANSVRRIMTDSFCDVRTALAWAASTRNNLVLRLNLVFPNVLNNELPSMKKRTDSHNVADNLNAMHRARGNYIRVEPSELIKQALSHNVRATISEQLQCGDKVE